MGEPDLFVSTEKEVEVDAETQAAIDRGLRDADEGRGVPAERVRELLSEWISNLSTEAKP
jgi:predicted transcriptional regulator